MSSRIKLLFCCYHMFEVAEVVSAADRRRDAVGELLLMSVLLVLPILVVVETSLQCVHCHSVHYRLLKSIPFFNCYQTEISR